ncbi:MAG: hypothetical protein ABIG32_02575 [Candidatus Uhrbacteria bacterium]|nr:hypothetical protein [Patescibacteria group bacterium]MBU1907019.1 hypothetical protein [Patescibacteria group bacterium]
MSTIHSNNVTKPNHDPNAERDDYIDSLRKSPEEKVTINLKTTELIILLLVVLANGYFGYSLLSLKNQGIPTVSAATTTTAQPATSSTSSSSTTSLPGMVGGC